MESLPLGFARYWGTQRYSKWNNFEKKIVFNYCKDILNGNNIKKFKFEVKIFEWKE